MLVRVRGLNRSRGRALRRGAKPAPKKGLRDGGLLSEDEGLLTTSHQTGAPHDRHGYQPIAPAHDRRHDDPQAHAENPTYLRALRQGLLDLLWQVAGQGGVRGRPPLPASPDLSRRLAMQRQRRHDCATVLLQVTLRRLDISEHIPLVPQPSKVPVILSPEEVARLLEAARGAKYKAALSVAYGAGLRASEIISLKVSDIDSKRMLIRVEQGKGRKDRFAMLSPHLLQLLRTWWLVERPRGYLFPGRDRINPLTVRQLHRGCFEAAQTAGINKRVSPHVLRHSFATHLLERNVDIRVIQVLLGHAKLDTTAIYTRVATKVIQEVTSPLEHLIPKHGNGESLAEQAELATPVERRKRTTRTAPSKGAKPRNHAKPHRQAKPRNHAKPRRQAKPRKQAKASRQRKPAA